MTAGEVVGLVASSVSITLAIVAIWLALHHYHAGRNTEREVSKALSGIKAQTTVLSKLLGTQLDRLTEHLTERAQEPDSRIARPDTCPQGGTSAGPAG